MVQRLASQCQGKTKTSVRAVARHPDSKKRSYEAVLRTEIGGPRVMRAQWQHVINLVESGRIRLQVMPFSAGANGGPDGPFVIFGMSVRGMDVVMIDNIASVAYLEHDDEVQRIKTLFDVLRATALGPGPSLDLIKQAAHQP